MFVQFVVNKSKSSSGNTTNKVAGIDWNFNSWGGKIVSKAFIFNYSLSCCCMHLYSNLTRSPHLTGAEDGCYTDWSLDLLVAKKVSETDKFPGPHCAVIFCAENYVLC